MFSRLPDNVELLEITTVADPIGSYVEGFGLSLFHSTADDTSCGAVVGDHRCSWLGMAHVVEALSEGDSFFCVEVQADHLCLCCR